MHTNRQHVIELARNWLNESRAVSEHIGNFSGHRIRATNEAERQRLGEQLRALRVQLLRFFVLEVDLLRQLRNLRGRYHHELGTCTEMILEEHHYVLSNLSRAIEYCDADSAEDSDLDHPQKLYFDAFYGYWCLLQDGTRSAIQLALPAFPSIRNREGTLAC
ncbi:MAG: hypothetical protein AB8B50_09315 [Pirellulaceae bacterium]